MNGEDFRPAGWAWLPRTLVFLYLRRMLRRSFDSVWLREGVLPESGFVFAASHETWWDPFLAYVWHLERLPQRFALMSDISSIRRLPLIRHCGAFSVDPHSPRTFRRSLEHAAELAAGGAGVWIFPQGIGTIFRRGFAVAAGRANVPVVPIAFRCAMRKHQKPEAFIALGRAVGPQTENLVEVVDSRIAGLLASIDADIASDAIEARYERFIGGRPSFHRRATDRAAGLYRLVRRE